MCTPYARYQLPPPLARTEPDPWWVLEHARLRRLAADRRATLRENRWGLLVLGAIVLVLGWLVLR